MKKKTWLLIMMFDDIPDREIKTIYRKKTFSDMQKDMEVFQDMNPDLLFELVELEPKSTYDYIIYKDTGKIMFVDCKNNGSESSVVSFTFEEIQDEMLREEPNSALVLGDITYA